MSKLCLLLAGFLSNFSIFAQSNDCCIGVPSNSQSIQKIICELSENNIDYPLQLFDEKKNSWKRKYPLLTQILEFNLETDSVQAHKIYENARDLFKKYTDTKSGKNREISIDEFNEISGKMSCVDQAFIHGKENISRKNPEKKKPTRESPKPGGKGKKPGNRGATSNITQELLNRIDSLYNEVRRKDNEIMRLNQMIKDSISSIKSEPVMGSFINYEIDVYFRVNKFEIDKSEIAKLDDVVNFQLNHCSDCIVSLDGFADSSGDAEYNQKLSENRVRKVQLYFTEAGIDPTLIENHPFGELGEGKNNARNVNIKLMKRIVLNRKSKEIKP